MGIKTTVSATTGMTQTGGLEGLIVEKNASNSGFSPFTHEVSAITTTGTTSTVGMHTISGSSALTVILPDPATIPGAMYTFRNLSAHAHILTASVTAVLQTISDTTTSGTRITMSASVGKAVSLMSDGRSYTVFAPYSASYTIAG